MLHTSFHTTVPQRESGGGLFFEGVGRTGSVSACWLAVATLTLGWGEKGGCHRFDVN